PLTSGAGSSPWTEPRVTAGRTPPSREAHLRTRTLLVAVVALAAARVVTDRQGQGAEAERRSSSSWPPGPSQQYPTPAGRRRSSLRVGGAVLASFASRRPFPDRGRRRGPCTPRRPPKGVAGRPSCGNRPGEW